MRGSPFADGEPIRETKLIRAGGAGYMAAILPTGMRAVSTDISPERGVGGFVLPNDHVDVILTRRDKDAEASNGGIEVQVSETILTNVRVLAIGKTVEEKSGQTNVDGTIATLELTPAMAERLALAHQLGTLSLALRSLVDSGTQKQADGKRPRADSIVVYRGAESRSLQLHAQLRSPRDRADRLRHRAAAGRERRRRSRAEARRPSEDGGGASPPSVVRTGSAARSWT